MGDALDWVGARKCGFGHADRTYEADVFLPHFMGWERFGCAKGDDGGCGMTDGGVM